MARFFPLQVFVLLVYISFLLFPYPSKDKPHPKTESLSGHMGNAPGRKPIIFRRWPLSKYLSHCIPIRSKPLSAPVMPRIKPRARKKDWAGCAVVRTAQSDRRQMMVSPRRVSRRIVFLGCSRDATRCRFSSGQVVMHAYYVGVEIECLSPQCENIHGEIQRSPIAAPPYQMVRTTTGTPPRRPATTKRPPGWTEDAV